MGLQDPCFSKKMKISKSSGVTYVELLVTIAIIGIVSALAIAGYVGGEQRQRVVYAAQQIEQDIRKVQTLSLAGKKDNAASQRPCGYGIKFDNNAASYVLFRDMPDCSSSNKIYDSGEKLGETVQLPKDLKIVFTGSSPKNVYYSIPFAEVFVDGVSLVGETIDVTNSSFTKTITIKNTGEVSVN